MRRLLDKLFAPKSCPMGLEIGLDCVRMIQLSYRDDQFFVECAERRPLEPGLDPAGPLYQKQLLGAIREIRDHGRFSGQEVIFCLPGDRLRIKSMRLDSIDPESLEKMIYSDTMKRFGLNHQQDEIRWLIAGNVFQGEEIKNEVIFFGMDREELTTHLDILQEARLYPVSVDAMPCALFRSFQRSLRREEDQEVVSVLVDLGTRYTTVIIARGKVIVFVKQIPLAGDHLNEAIALALKVDVAESMRLVQSLQESSESRDDTMTKQAVNDAMRSIIEDLAREISLCFKYYAVTFRGQRPTEMVFAGGNMYESALMEALSRQLNVTIRIAEPLRGFDLSRATFDRRPNPRMGEWAVAVGLALKYQTVFGMSSSDCPEEAQEPEMQAEAPSDSKDSDLSEKTNEAVTA